MDQPVAGIPRPTWNGCWREISRRKNTKRNRSWLTCLPSNAVHDRLIRIDPSAAPNVASSDAGDAGGENIMAKDRGPRLQSRYSLILNTYRYERVSKCPLCKRPTHNRKFALLVEVEELGPVALGKTCRYCTPCELIIVHQHELEAELAHGFQNIRPEVIGNDYLLIGTIDKKVWKAGLEGGAPPPNLQEHATVFKKSYNYTVEPAGWRPE